MSNATSAAEPPPLLLQNFINGEFVDCGDFLDSENPATGRVNAKVPIASAEDVDRAVKAAKEAFVSWCDMPISKRCDYLTRLAATIQENFEDFAKAESEDQGKPLALAKVMDIPRALLNLRFFAESSKYQMTSGCWNDDSGALNYVERRPIGVAALILPWNLPLYLLTFKLAPCLAFGNTCVIKPSEMTSVTAFMLSQAIDKVGFPKGVVNVVFGNGKITGQALISHPLVRLISFTGSTVVGTAIQRESATDNKKCSLEMGGKNAAIVCEDANLENAVATCVRSSFLNQGEVCLCTSRIFVQRKIFDEFLRRFLEATKEWTVGDPRLETTKVGALISSAHKDKVIGFIERAKKQQATIHCGHTVNSLELPEELKNGHFVPPTVITNVECDSECMQQEIFGPVTCIVPFNDIKEAIEKANGVQYGLCATLFTENLTMAHRIARQLEVGTVWVNTWLLRDLRLPFGGVKFSGSGREGMADSLDFYTEKTTVCVKMGDL
jgi:acyl-CoA reductase-like NAD-dependent aldehyde dehydrogenase